jgi:thiol-disulfide isomerase/thioredoxin
MSAPSSSPPVRGPLRRVAIAAALAGAVATSAASVADLAAQSAAPPWVTAQLAPAAGDTIPYGWRVRDLDGRDVSLEAYRGRPIVLNLWATWCAPCVAELASIAALRDSLDARGQDDVVFLLVAPETREQVSRFARRRPAPLPFVVELDPLPAALGVRTVPSTWLVARDGRIALVRHGAAEWDAAPVVQRVSSILR